MAQDNDDLAPASYVEGLARRGFGGLTRERCTANRVWERLASKRVTCQQHPQTHSTNQRAERRYSRQPSVLARGAGRPRLIPGGAGSTPMLGE